jgi:hypothetical protein
MIDKVLNILADELNAYCNEKLQIQENIVVLSNITNPDGSVSPGIDNKIVFTLVSINEDIEFRNIPPGNTPKSTLANLSLSVLFSACFGSNNYNEGLRYISVVMDFFRQKSIFIPANTTGMDTSIEKIAVQLLPMTKEDQYQLWSTLRTSYLPSVVYQIQAQIPQSIHPQI